MLLGVQVWRPVQPYSGVSGCDDGGESLQGALRALGAGDAVEGRSYLRSLGRIQRQGRVPQGALRFPVSPSQAGGSGCHSHLLIF